MMLDGAIPALDSGLPVAIIGVFPTRDRLLVLMVQQDGTLDYTDAVGNIKVVVGQADNNIPWALDRARSSVPVVATEAPEEEPKPTYDHELSK